MKKQDLLWKGIIRDFFPQFIAFFFPDWEKEIDLSKGYEFAEKELEQILPEAETKGRRADILVKVWSLKGDEFWFLIHVEVQGYFDEDFAERMYVIQYRLFDRFRKPVGALAILTDNRTDFHPKAFSYQCLSTDLRYGFGTFKVMDFPPELLAPFFENPFSIIMETAWYGLQQRKLKDEEILLLKFDLVKRLFQRGFNKTVIRKILLFIKYYMTFDKKDFYHKFDEIIQPVKNSSDMGIEELILEDAKQEGIAIGEVKGIKKGIEKGIAIGEEQGVVKGIEKGIAIGEEQGVVKGIEKGIAIGEEKGVVKGIEKGLQKGIEQTLAIQRLLFKGETVAAVCEKLKVKKTLVLKIKKAMREMN